jgi:hypothetical protein
LDAKPGFVDPDSKILRERVARKGKSVGEQSEPNLFLGD